MAVNRPSGTAEPKKKNVLTRIACGEFAKEILYRLRRAVWVNVYRSVAEEGSCKDAGSKEQQVHKSQQEERRACVPTLGI